MAMHLTNEEATALIKMLKEYVQEQSIEFPHRKEKIQFDVCGERMGDEFVINIERKGINNKGCTYQGREKSNNMVLLRLDVNPTAKHRNPSNGEVITGTHLHIYTEEHETKEAIPFDVGNKDLYEICFRFFNEFNVTNNPIVPYQMNIFDQEGQCDEY